MTKKEQIVKMLSEGNSYKTIRDKLGVAISTVAYHAKNMGVNSKGPVRGTYDWDQVQKLYDTGLCLVELCMETGIHKATISKAVKDGKLIIDRTRLCHQKNEYSNEFVFKENSTVTAAMVKRRIKRDELMEYKCSTHDCILSHVNPEWNGKPIVLHLDHINGVSNDHRLENLRWLCPNCHTQTDTYCGRNKKASRN